MYPTWLSRISTFHFSRGLPLYRLRPRFQRGFLSVLKVRLNGVLLFCVLLQWFCEARMNIQQPETVSRECLESVRSATEDLQFDVFIGKMLDEMKTVRVELAERERQLAEERINVEGHILEVKGIKETIEEREQSISADGSRTKEKLKKTQAAFWEQENRNEELTEAVHTAEAHVQESNDRIRSIEEERDSLREKLDAATNELSQIAGVNEMFESTQSELTETQSQLVQARDELDQVKLRGDSKTDDRVRKLEGEKRSFESELEQSRAQIERLTMKVEDQKQPLSDHRTRWTEEIKHLRKAFESRTPNETSGNLETDSAVTSDAKQANVNVEVKEPSTPQKRSESSDPVIGSILAQFEELESLSDGLDDLTCRLIQGDNMKKNKFKKVEVVIADADDR